MGATQVMRSRGDYEARFKTAKTAAYPAIDELEARFGFAMPRPQLEVMAFVLANPVKVNPPSWQHGRVIYAVAREYLQRRFTAGKGNTRETFVDIGTAKGFSALCLAWALTDHAVEGRVLSYDVIDPLDRKPRNSVRDLEDKFPTVPELVDEFLPQRGGVKVEFFGVPFPNAVRKLNTETSTFRAGVAFIDGKHTYADAAADAVALVPGQEVGDYIIFDDVQVPGVMQAARELERDSRYHLEEVAAGHDRRYIIAQRR